jgi:hypothetical protein
MHRQLQLQPLNPPTASLLLQAFVVNEIRQDQGPLTLQLWPRVLLPGRLEVTRLNRQKHPKPAAAAINRLKSLATARCRLPIPRATMRVTSTRTPTHEEMMPMCYMN